MREICKCGDTCPQCGGERDWKVAQIVPAPGWFRADADSNGKVGIDPIAFFGLEHDGNVRPYVMDGESGMSPTGSDDWLFHESRRPDEKSLAEFGQDVVRQRKERHQEYLKKEAEGKAK